MGGMILLIILVPLIILLLQASILSRSSEQRRLLETLYDQVKALSSELTSLTKKLKDPEPPPVLQPVFQEKKMDPFPGKSPEPAVTVPEIRLPVPEPIKQPEPVSEPENIPLQEMDSLPIPPSDPGSGGMKNKPETRADIETFIGENVTNKIGIAVLVLGISFFVKYAIDKNWLNEAGRVVTGIICGTVLIGFAHRYRHRYRSFSSVLIGGGLTVYYFSIAFAFHQYHLIGQETAFFLMIITAGLAVFLSLRYDRLELAVLATVGAFITPFLVSTGQENHVALFSYICIVNAGLIVLSWFKKWPSINSIALFFTTIIFGSWLVRHFYFSERPVSLFGDAFLFASLFYLQFIIMTILNSLRLKKQFQGFDFILLLSINFLYYAAGMIILGAISEGRYQGVFTAGLGLFKLILTAVFHQKEKVDKHFKSLLMGLSLTFISVFAPVEFNGHHITLFWLSESLVLLFLFQRTRIKLLKIASLLLSGLFLFSLLTIWIQVYLRDTSIISIIMNKGFITSVSAGAGLLLYRRLMKKEPDQFILYPLTTKKFQLYLQVTAVMIFYLAGLLELYFQFYTRYPAVPVFYLFITAYTFIFSSVLLRLSRFRIFFNILQPMLTFSCLGLYLFTISTHFNIAEALLSNGYGTAFFWAHWVTAIVILWLLFDFVRYINRNIQWQGSRSAFYWLIIGSIVLVLSLEMYQLLLWTNPLRAEQRDWWENLYFKAGLSILWGICSFVIMWLGMKNRIRTFRVISLSLFALTLGKLFLYDIRNIPPGGKIAAFILLGCLLLIVSFMYQRLKRMILDGTTDTNPEADDHL